MILVARIGFIKKKKMINPIAGYTAIDTES